MHLPSAVHAHAIHTTTPRTPMPHPHPHILPRSGVYALCTKSRSKGRGKQSAAPAAASSSSTRLAWVLDPLHSGGGGGGGDDGQAGPASQTGEVQADLRITPQGYFVVSVKVSGSDWRAGGCCMTGSRLIEVDTHGFHPAPSLSSLECYVNGRNVPCAILDDLLRALLEHSVPCCPLHSTPHSPSLHPSTPPPPCSLFLPRTQT